MQQSRGRVMAQMGMLKSIDDEMIRGGQLVNQRPDLYDAQLYQESVDYVNEKGMMPPQGFVFKAVEDPFIYSDKMLNSANMGWVEEDIYTGTEGGVHQYEKKGEYQLKGKSAEDTVEKMLKDRNLQYHVQLSFDRLPEEQKQSYISQAQGNETAAANNWYRDGMIPELNRQTLGVESEKTRAAYKPTPTTQAKAEQKTYETTDGSIMVVNGKDAFNKAGENASTAIIGKGAGMGIMGNELVALPADKMDFNMDIEFDPGSLIWVKPTSTVFKNDMLEASVDPTRNGDVWINVGSEEDVPLENFKKMEELPDGRIRYRGKLKALTAATSVNVAREPLDRAYGNQFSSTYDRWKASWAAESGADASKQVKAASALWDGVKSLFGGKKKALSVVEQFMRDNPQIKTEEEAMRIIEEEMAKGTK